MNNKQCYSYEIQVLAFLTNLTDLTIYKETKLPFNNYANNKSFK